MLAGQVPVIKYADEIGKAFANMNEACFEHLDYVIQRAAHSRLHSVAECAFSGSGRRWYPGDTRRRRELQIASDADLAASGAYLDNCRKAYPNIIWMLGGDCDLTDYPILKSKMDDIATGIRSARHVRQQLGITTSC
jgi:hypothetical protein